MTPAITALERASIAHRVMTYDHDPANQDFGREAAEQLGIDPDLVYKTLVVALDGRAVGPGHAVAIVAVSGRLDLKALAAVAGVKRAVLADHGEAERITGYVRGGISPLGQRKALPTFIDAAAEAVPLIYVSGGRRGLDIELSPIDLVTATGGRFASIRS